MTNRPRLHLLALFASQLTAAVLPPSDPLLFICHDAGESYMALPAAQSLADEGFNVTVLALGEPASSIFLGENDYPFASVGLEAMGINVTIEDGTREARAQLLGPEALAKVSDYFSGGAPGVVASGMVYAMQAEIAEALKRVGNRQEPVATQGVASGAYVVGLDDSFALWSDSSLPARLFVAPRGRGYRATCDPPCQVADEVMVTAQSIAEGSRALNPAVVATVTGSPTLDAWGDDVGDASEVARARELLVQQYEDANGGGSDLSSLKVLVYAGGYGGDAYTASLKVLCGAAVALAQDLYSFVFAPHPGYNASYEASLFEEWGCLGGGGAVSLTSLFVAEDGWEMSTGQLVAASNGSLSEGSTVGGQSLSIGKPHAYTALKYTDVFTAAALIPTAPSVDALVAVVNVTFRAAGFSVAPEEVEAAGVPLNGTANVAARLAALLGPDGSSGAGRGLRSSALSPLLALGSHHGGSSNAAPRVFPPANQSRYGSVASLEARAAACAANPPKLYAYPGPRAAGRVEARRSYWKLETKLWDLLPKHAWVRNPEEADFFVVHNYVFGNWRIGRKNAQGPYISSKLLPELSKIVEGKYYKRYGGRDHLIVYVGDNGITGDCLPFDVPVAKKLVPLIEPMIKVGYFGRTDVVEGDTHRSWKAGRDIMMPMFNSNHERPMPDAAALIAKGVSPKEGKADLYFRGNFGDGCHTCDGITYPSCSAYIRPWIKIYSDSHAEKVSDAGMESAWFALCPAGAGCWSSRLFDAIDRLAIPVILANGAVQPFEALLDWAAFSVTIDTDPLLTCALKGEGGRAPFLLERENKTKHVGARSALPCHSAEVAAKESMVFEPLYEATRQLREACGSEKRRTGPCQEALAAGMIRRLAEVREFFNYNPGSPKSAWGMLLLELEARKNSWQRAPL